jgi:hypothetical protein
MMNRELVLCAHCGRLEFADQVSGRIDRRRKCSHSDTVFAHNLPDLIASFHDHFAHARSRDFKKNFRKSYSDLQAAHSLGLQLEELLIQVRAIEAVIARAKDLSVQVKAILLSTLKDILFFVAAICAILSSFADEVKASIQMEFGFGFEVSTSQARMHP